MTTAAEPTREQMAPRSGGPAGRRTRARVTDGVDLLDAFIVPGAIFLVFVCVPLLALVYRAVESGTLWESLQKPVVHEALRVSLVTSTVTLVTIVVCGTPLAYLLARSDFPGKRVVDTLIDLPMMLPPVVAGVALLMAFGRRGVLGSELESLGVELAFNTKAVILAQIFVSAPFYVRGARVGFQGVDPLLEQMSYTLGCSRINTFRRISLPLALPAILGGMVLCWARAVSEFGATMMFAGNFRGTTQTMPLAIMTSMESDLYAALSISVVLLVFSFGVLLIARLLGRGRAQF